MTSLKSVLVVVLALGSSLEAAAQTAPDRSRSAVKRWSLSAGAATSLAGPARQFEDALRSAHFDHTSPAFFGSAIPHPFSRRELFLEYDVTYRRSGSLALGFVMSRTHLGTTLGYQDSFKFLFLSSKVTLLAPIAYRRLGNHAHVGAGPLVAWTNTVGDAGGVRPGYTSVTGGGIVAATLEANPLRILNLAVTASYRWIAPVELGAFTAASSFSSATLPPMRANLSHASVGVRLGMRF